MLLIEQPDVFDSWSDSESISSQIPLILLKKEFSLSPLLRFHGLLLS